jgi:hypothetical protein
MTQEIAKNKKIENYNCFTPKITSKKYNEWKLGRAFEFKNLCSVGQAPV